MDLGRRRTPTIDSIIGQTTKDTLLCLSPRSRSTSFYVWPQTNLVAFLIDPLFFQNIPAKIIITNLRDKKNIHYWVYIHQSESVIRSFRPSSKCVDNIQGFLIVDQVFLCQQSDGFLFSMDAMKEEDQTSSMATDKMSIIIEGLEKSCHQLATSSLHQQWKTDETLSISSGRNELKESNQEEDVRVFLFYDGSILIPSKIERERVKHDGKGRPSFSISQSPPSRINTHAFTSWLPAGNGGGSVDSEGELLAWPPLLTWMKPWRRRKKSWRRNPRCEEKKMFRKEDDSSKGGRVTYGSIQQPILRSTANWRWRKSSSSWETHRKGHMERFLFRSCWPLYWKKSERRLSIKYLSTKFLHADQLLSNQEFSTGQRENQFYLDSS